MSRMTMVGILALLLAAHAGFLLVGSFRNFVVIDEAAHIPSGLSHWELGDFGLYRVNPPLGRMLATLPLSLASPFVDFRGLDRAPGARDEFAQASLFAELNTDRYIELVCLARLAGVAWSLLGAWLIFAWGRELYGAGGGLLGAALWCVNPTVLAFAPVVIPDVPAAVGGLAATYAYWRFLRGGRWDQAVIAGLLLGIAELLKFTLLIFYGIWPLLWAIRRFDRHAPATSRPRLAQGLAIVGISLYVINLGYGFRESGIRLGDFEFVSRSFTGERPSDDPLGKGQGSGNRFRGTWLSGVPVPVPADFLRGIDIQRKDFENGFPSYLAGRWQHGGWWYYYLYALAVKEPIGTISLVLWALALCVACHPANASRFDEAALLIPAVSILTFVSSQTGFSHHMRYVLPIFPFIAVATGKLAGYFDRDRRAPSFLIGALLIWSAGSSLNVAPHWMSYFNEVVAGPSRGHHHLLDSNMDWGQDLLDLKEWLDRHPEAQPLGLAYFHVIDPALFGIEYHLPAPGPDEVTPRDSKGASAYGPRPGYFAVSVQLLQGARFRVSDGRGGRQSITRHDYFAYFRLFQPIARAGYSILIYHVTPLQADAARRQLGMPPLPGRQGADSAEHGPGGSGRGDGPFDPRSSGGNRDER